MSLSAQAAHMAELRADNDRLRVELDRRMMQISVLNREIAVMKAMQVVVDAKAAPHYPAWKNPHT